MRALQRFAVLCLILVLSAWLFYIGREHQVFLDNKTIEAGGQSFRALDFVRVSVAGKPPVELMPRDRDVMAAVGPRFTVKVELMDEFGEEVERVVEKEITPGFSGDMMLSLPLLAAGRDDFLLPPPTAALVREDREDSEKGEPPDAIFNGPDKEPPL
ncbi:MAG: hypothetical protein LBP21_01760 [Synergistaceae bacterium]|nr:hypothetical protein [Synergistaceae bacterium]